MKPKRIQRKRTKGWRMPDGAVYVGRATKWGNPFVVDPGRANTAYRSCETAEEAVEYYRLHVGADCWSDREPIPDVDTIQRELRGKDLLCWCKPGDPCHADVLLEIANR